MNGYNILAAVAYILSVISYTARFPQAFADPRKTVILGTLLLVLGYGFLTVTKLLTVKKNNFDDETKKSKTRILMLLGFGTLAVMFSVSFVIPINFVVRYYDPFAAVGYAVLFLATLLPKVIEIKYGQAIILIYYLLGGLYKVGETELPEVGLMISRLMLAVYNGAALFAH